MRPEQAWNCRRTFRRARAGTPATHACESRSICDSNTSYVSNRSKKSAKNTPFATTDVFKYMQPGDRYTVADATEKNCRRTPGRGRAARRVRGGNSSGSPRALSKRIGYVRGFARFPAIPRARRSLRAWRCRKGRPRTPVRAGSRCVDRQSRRTAAQFRYIRMQICAPVPASGLCLAGRAPPAHQGSARRQPSSTLIARNPARSRYSHGRFWSEVHAATA